MPFSYCSRQASQPFMYGDITGWNSTTNHKCKKEYTSKKAEVIHTIDKIVDAQFLKDKLNNDIQTNILEYEKGQRQHKKIDTRFNTKCKIKPEVLNSIM